MRTETEQKAADIHDIATDIANCVFGSLAVKMATRRNIVNLVIAGIDLSKLHNGFRDELEKIVRFHS